MVYLLLSSTNPSPLLKSEDKLKEFLKQPQRIQRILSKDNKSNQKQITTRKHKDCWSFCISSKYETLFLEMYNNNQINLMLL